MARMKEIKIQDHIITIIVITNAEFTDGEVNEGDSHIIYNVEGGEFGGHVMSGEGFWDRSIEISIDSKIDLIGVDTIMEIFSVVKSYIEQNYSSIDKF